VTVPLAAFNGATAGPAVATPEMISAGDSVMWGQGLLPASKFREIVRLRLQRELGRGVAEMSLAHSGAWCTPASIRAGREDVNDDAITGPMLQEMPGASVPPRYNSFGFVREIPGASPTTIAQIQAAEGIIADPAPENPGNPADVRLIVLDGGANDTGVFNIVMPTAAIEAGGPLASWESWIFDRSLDVRAKMVLTLTEALTLFPNAAVVVTGYYPIFSPYSVASLGKLQVAAAVLTASLVPLGSLIFPATIMAASSASRAWQVASNRRLREAVAAARGQFPGRSVVFARSNIEGPRCLFGPDSNLWEFDGQIDTTPETLADLALVIAGITPEDQVPVQRRAAMAARVPPSTDPIVGLASLGHPNVAGAVSYATSIIDSLEFAGVFSPSRPQCDQANAARWTRCQAARDDWDFFVLRAQVRIDAACSRTANAILGKAGEVLGVAGSAWGRLTLRPAAAAECYTTTGASVAACAATEATAIATCNAAFATRMAGPCAIFCTNFTGCRTSFGRFDPRRAICLASRVGCVAAAAASRLACRGAAEAVRAACIALAIAVGIACRSVAVARDTACAVGQVLAGVADLVVAGGALLAAGTIALLGVGVLAGCRIAEGAVGLVGNIGGWGGQRLCEGVSEVRRSGCRVTTIFTIRGR